jgi:hypothetical protein
MFGLVLKYSIHLFIPLAASNPPRLCCQLFLTIMKTCQIYLNGLRMDVNLQCYPTRIEINLLKPRFAARCGLAIDTQYLLYRHRAMRSFKPKTIKIKKIGTSQDDCIIKKLTEMIFDK